MIIESDKSIGISFNGKSSTDFGLETLVDRTIGLPNRTLIPVTMPYSNDILDLSSYYGIPLYTERTLQYTFLLPNFTTKQSLNDFYGQLQSWLYSPMGKVPLIDGADPMHYFMAQVVSAPTRTEITDTGTITVSFTGYPYRYESRDVGSDEWDTFDFVNDVAQATTFAVSGSLAISIINASQTASLPIITTSDNITIKDSSGNSFEFLKGANDQTEVADQMFLKIGENDFTITGNADVDFHWQNEVI